jgi:phosphomannomutase
MALFFSLSGLRGKIGEDISPEMVTGYGRAFGAYSGQGPVVLGRDARRSSTMLYHAAASGLVAAGGSGINLGIVPTPTVLLMVTRLKAKGGLVVTASHNPFEWNGLKFISPNGSFLNSEEFEAFSRILNQKNFECVPYEKLGGMEEYGRAREEHLEQILNHRFVKKASLKKIKIGVDAGNGAASLFGPELLRRLGAEVHELYCSPDGSSPRPPEPIEENLTDLARFVREQELDLGFAFDPDGDRLACVDEQGKPIGEERTLALAAVFVLEKKKGPVVINLSTSRTTEAVANHFGSHVYRTPIGEANVVARMRQVSAVIGGEGNGGVIFPEINYGRDGLVAAALIFNLLVEKDQPISRLVGGLPQYFMKKVKVTVGSGIDWGKIKDVFHGRVIDETDGIRVDDADFWLHIRSSKTEPVVRIIAEATTQSRVDSLIAEVLKFFRER